MRISTEFVIERFGAWFQEASKHPAITEPAAMSLATVDASGAPSVRIVLLKGYDARGFCFYTNLESRKACALMETHKAALCFYWMPLARQVRIEGEVEAVNDAEADAYFLSRSRESRLGAWASIQSRPLEGREVFMRRVEEMRARFEGADVPRPSFWGGFRVVPSSVEFWTEKPYRMHEREVYTRTGDGWGKTLLYP